MSFPKFIKLNLYDKLKSVRLSICVGFGHHSVLLKSLVLIILLSGLHSQGWYNHPELDWRYFETDHFIVHFHQGTERSAREAAIIAEKMYPPLTMMYQYEPDSKTHLIIKDTDDYSNGAAYYYDNKIEIWARPLDFDLRGSHRWMQDVIAHEFTHIIQIQASMKYNRKLPGFYFQSLQYEKEKRDDVLYGYPNVIISYPIPGTAVPPWFAEGTAQYMFEGANFDYWDSHRDMILRDRILFDKLLNFDEMNTFGKKGIGNESIYNQGFAFVKYIGNRFGSDCLRKISSELTNKFNYSIRKAMKNATGIDGKEIYFEWKKQLQTDYIQKTRNVIENQVTGDIIIRDGTTNVHPVWAPEGNRFLFLSNMDNDYFSQTDLFLYDLNDSTTTKLMSGVQTAPCWVNDSTVVYARKNKPNRDGSRYFDLFQLDINTEEETRLTEDLRLISPVINTKTNIIAAINTFDGTSNIFISELDSINFHQLTDENNGIQMFSLDWSGEDILVDAVTHHGRGIYSVGPNGELTEFLIGIHDERDQNKFHSLMSWSSDETGIYNLKLTNGIETNYITNVTGGAFMPDISADGKIIYSLYNDGRFNIAIINDPKPINSDIVGYTPDYANQFPNSEWINYGD
ncbi:MAG: TolB family protein, partial [Fidelibacterota bacterium]